MIDEINSIIEKLKWEDSDDIVVEIGGTVVSGIHQGENCNKKWATPYGVRKYNFHIIPTRNDLFNDLSRGIMESVY